MFAYVRRSWVHHLLINIALNDPLLFYSMLLSLTSIVIFTTLMHITKEWKYSFWCFVCPVSHIESLCVCVFVRFTGADGPSGFGFELTFRLKREVGETAPPTWPAELMQGLARYVFQSGKSTVFFWGGGRTGTFCRRVIQTHSLLLNEL